MTLDEFKQTYNLKTTLLDYERVITESRFRQSNYRVCAARRATSTFQTLISVSNIVVIRRVSIYKSHIPLRSNTPTIDFHQDLLICVYKFQTCNAVYPTFHSVIERIRMYIMSTVTCIQ